MSEGFVDANQPSEGAPEAEDPRKTILFRIQELEGPKVAHHLTVVRGAASQSSVEVEHWPLVLGRDAQREFHLPHPGVSRSHCEVRLADGELVVRDLGSMNGTYVGGQRVHGESVLPAGAMLQIGEHLLRHDVLTPEEASSRARLAKELERARRYVMSMIPAPIETGPISTDWCFLPSSELGGDALGYHELGDGRWAIYVVDVCGHGVDSAMHSASVLKQIRGETLPDTDFGDPAQVLERINGLFPMEAHGGMFFTIWYGAIDPATRSLRYASGGHAPALALARDGTLRRLGTKNPPIGAFGAREFTQAETVLAPGERLYVYSDGAYEITGHDGRERTIEDFERALVEHPDRSRGEPARLFERALATRGAALLEDDYTLLVVSIP